MAKKILVADDEPNIVRQLSLRLKANNYEVVGACDGIYAIRQAHMEKPDLIILDIKMPAGSGITVCENLKSSVETMNIPIIFITAYPSKEMEKKTQEIGGVDFIAKPFSDEELLAKVRKALGEEE
jgi:DNA-binding response OmpR family regulator